MAQVRVWLRLGLREKRRRKGVDKVEVRPALINETLTCWCRAGEVALDSLFWWQLFMPRVKVGASGMIWS